MWIKCGERYLNLSECGEVRHTSSGDYSVIVQGICRTIAAADAQQLAAAMEAQAVHTGHLLDLIGRPAEPSQPPMQSPPMQILVKEAH